MKSTFVHGEEFKFTIDEFTASASPTTELRNLAVEVALAIAQRCYGIWGSVVPVRDPGVARQQLLMMLTVAFEHGWNAREQTDQE